ARIAGHTYMVDAARGLTASAVDRGERPSVISALLKRESTERMRLVINDAMDVQGGAGICVGPRNMLASTYQAIPIGITVEGANILTRSMIVFGQGAIRAHPWLLKELEAARNPDRRRGLVDFDTALFGHLRFSVSNGIRLFWMGLTGARFQLAPMGLLEGRYFRYLNQMSTAFVFAADLALALLGGTMKRKEFLSGRFADLLSHMYMGSAALKRFSDEGRPRADQPLLEWSLRYSLYEGQQALLAIYDNYPLRWLGSVLRRVTFPFGPLHTPPNDLLTARVAATLLAPSETRERLTEGIFHPAGPGTPRERLERALRAVITAEPVERKLRQALADGRLNGRYVPPFWDKSLLNQAVASGVIDDGGMRQVLEADALRAEVVQVDAFPQEPLEVRFTTPMVERPLRAVGGV
ncbi:MAG: DUF1974 domain-containing protein, partial [Magnetococcales bacterium]|nr:DUF1974 domain-containing protein [Magnetococcales bacterium]